MNKLFHFISINTAWNSKQIQWFDYETGTQLAKQSSKNVMLIFYADWCPTCHAYSRLFRDTRIIEKAKDLIMIRVNVDQSPQIASRYTDNGEYVPRIYVLNEKPEKINTLFKQRNYSKHFVAANAIDDFISLMPSVNNLKGYSQ